ncbi:unnamed protein product [Gordionus sp. m RMFG-2023]
MLACNLTGGAENIPIEYDDDEKESNYKTITLPAKKIVIYHKAPVLAEDPINKDKYCQVSEVSLTKTDFLVTSKIVTLEFKFNDKLK